MNAQRYTDKKRERGKLWLPREKQKEIGRSSYRVYCSSSSAHCARSIPASRLSVTFVAGAGFIFAGIVNIISYVRERKTAGLSGWYVAYGILDIIIGLMLVIHPLATAYVIPWLIGAFIMAYSIVEIFSIIASRKQLGSIWGLGLVSAILSLLVGICFFIFPESLAIFIAVFAVIRGATLIASGWSGYQPV